VLLKKILGGFNISVKDAVIDTMKAAGKPLSAGELKKLTGLGRKIYFWGAGTLSIHAITECWLK
jgi:hypothetical protein